MFIKEWLLWPMEIRRRVIHLTTRRLAWFDGCTGHLHNFAIGEALNFTQHQYLPNDRMLALGSGDPTHTICSTLIAEAFQHVRYPVLPRIERVQNHTLAESDYSRNEILH